MEKENIKKNEEVKGAIRFLKSGKLGTLVEWRASW